MKAVGERCFVYGLSIHCSSLFSFLNDIYRPLIHYDNDCTYIGTDHLPRVVPNWETQNWPLERSEWTLALHYCFTDRPTGRLIDWFLYDHFKLLFQKNKNHVFLLLHITIHLWNLKNNANLVMWVYSGSRCAFLLFSLFAKPPHQVHKTSLIHFSFTHLTSSLMWPWNHTV